MELRKCGNTDMELSVLGAGCWSFGGGDYWGDQSQKDVNEVVRRSVELGINYFDTAEAYNDGLSEKSLGQALKEIARDKILIGTKISPANAYPDVLIKHCEQSLRRLDTEYIDIYMVHWPIHPHSIRHFTNDKNIIDNPPDEIEAFETLIKLQEQGKIRQFGVSNYSVDRMKHIRNCTKQIAVNQLPYSLLTRAIETGTLPYCRENNIAVIGYMTLLQGLLADIYNTLDDVPVWQQRTRHFNCRRNELCRHGESGAEEETNQALREIRAIAKDINLTMPQIAVKWAIASQGITCSLVGARDIKEVEANVASVSQPLPEEIVEQLNKVTNPVKEKMGPGFDYYESKTNDRTL